MRPAIAPQRILALGRPRTRSDSSVRCAACVQCATRTFSSSTARHTRQRMHMFRWLAGPGAVFRDPPSDATNYLGAYDRDGRRKRERRVGPRPDEEGSGPTTTGDADEGAVEAATSGAVDDTGHDLRPFPMNPYFRSQPVLDEGLRDEIHRRVMEQGKSVRVVSAELGVEMNRVGAVVRLKEVEKRWIHEGKKLAIPYHHAVLAMLPKTVYDRDHPTAHEPINDLTVHPATLPQIFHPTSEARVFTRADAAEVFHPGLLPADARIPHPELIVLERERLDDVPREERVERQRQRNRQKETDRVAEAAKRAARRARSRRIIPAAVDGGHGGRWEWHVKEIRVEAAGNDGRASTGVGWRYGVPHQDRKRGQIKIPTRVQ
ncbi:MAG: hypothetical protein M1826_001052 [Phylliscum demangeonii]|nr:MAG: hypothetical protein M1826_001052 [Phylliscum demangeonii]